jgi:AcrR family transcriptional regulator
MEPTKSRRDPILAAMIRVVGDKGYERTTAADVVAAAGTSRAAFHERFEDKHECFLAAYDALIERIFAEVAAVCDSERPWTDRVRSGLGTIVELFSLDPGLARAAVVEVEVAGAEARRRHWRAITRFAGLLEGGREFAGARELPEHIELMSAGAVSGLIFDAVQEGRAGQLPEMLPDLLFALLVPYIGPSAAAAEMRRAIATG